MTFGVFSDKSLQIRENHGEMYSKRKKFERSTNVYTLPLPWRPGWKNLLNGRPMGGNVFDGVESGAITLCSNC